METTAPARGNTARAAAQAAPRLCASRVRPVATRVPVRRALAFTALAALLCLLSLVPSPAQAAQTRVLQRTFGSSSTQAPNVADPYPLSNPEGVAVDTDASSSSEGDVYVADTGNDRVEKFGPNGEFLLMFGGDVNPMAADPDVCAVMETCQAGTKGSAPGAFETAKFIAIDQTTGDVYVADTGDGIVSKFSPEGELERSWGTEGQLNGSTTAAKEFGALAGIAVSSADELYVLNTNGVVSEFDPNSALAREVDLQEPEPKAAALGLAVNKEGDLFDVFPSPPFLFVLELSPTGGLLGVVNNESSSTFPSALTSGSGGLYFATEGDSLDHDEFNGTGEVLEPGGGTCTFFCNPSDSTAAGFVASGVGVAANGDTLLSNPAEGEVYEYGPLVTIPEAKTEERTTKIGPTSAQLNGTVNPGGLPVTECVFEYGETTSYGQTAACETEPPGPIGSGTSEVPVHADVEAFTPGTTYHFRLIARNANDPSPQTVPVPGLDESFETLPPPAIDSATVTGLTAKSAVLNAQIDPGGLPLESCDFEYGAEAGVYSHKLECTPETLAQVGSGTTPVPVTQRVEDLEPNRTYYWRVTASSVAGTTTSLQHTFIYQARESNGAGGLPDNRAYEMVTPNRKNGALIGDVSFVGGEPDIAASGSQVIASAIQCFGGAQSCNAANQNAIGSPYEFTRSEEAQKCAPAAAPCWYTTALVPPAREYTQNAEQAYSAQDGTALFSIPTGPPLGAGENDFYVREPERGSEPAKLVDVGPDTPPEAGAQGPHGGRVNGSEQAFTADFSHFVWDASYLWSSPFDEATGGHPEVYEYAPGAENRHLDVGVSGGYEEGESHNLISGCGTNLGEAAANVYSPGAMSADGQTVFFTALAEVAEAQCMGKGVNADQEVPVDEVFARVDGELGDAHTVAISEPDALETAGESPPDDNCTSSECEKDIAPPAFPAGRPNPNWRGAQFVGASEDGSQAFFESTQQLTDNATEDSDAKDEAVTFPKGSGCAATVGPNGCNLYDYEGVGSEHPSLVDVSEGVGGAPATGGPRVQGVMATSGAAGVHVYFVAQGELTTAERPGCMAEWVAAGRSSEAVCHAVAGKDNLYVYSQETHSVAFVTIMSDSDIEEWREEAGNPANVTPNGRFLVFVSHADLTADDTSRSGADQVFRYDAQSGRLSRISIGNEGFDDDGNRSAPTPCKINGDICSENASIARALLASRRDPTMSDDGSRVFFESPVGLTPQALDDVQIATAGEVFGERIEEETAPVYAQNVYEWEAEGVGSCPVGRATGCVSLISDGRDVNVNRGAASVCAHGSAVCLLGTDETGKNVFFTTTDRLVSSDTNTELDYYDARVCEPGSPCVQSSPASPACKDEECHGVPAGVPGVPAYPSQTFNGAGDVPPPTPVVQSRPLTRAQKLANALKACKKDKKKTKRKSCETSGRHKYGATRESRTSKKREKRGRK
jgi:DNA-binding beta-propeller fold protein YncE